MVLSGKILILEDDPGISILESRLVKSLGCEPKIAHNTKSALELLLEHDFEAIILDYNIGEAITGVEFYSSLKDRGIFIPAVLVTGLEDPQVLLNAIRSGVRDFVPKQDNFLTDLGIAVKRAVSQSITEKEATISKIVKEKNEILESVVSASEICYVLSKANSDTLYSWDGEIGRVFGDDSFESCKSRTELFSQIFSDDLTELKNQVKIAEDECSKFVAEVRLKNDVNRWIFIQGRCFRDSTRQQQSLILVFFNNSKRKALELDLLQSNMRMEAVNKRLQVGTTESHHRIKNSLQNVSSLINLKIKKSGSIDQEDGHKLSSHVLGLAKMHELLTNSSEDTQDTSNVSIAPIIKEITSSIQASMLSRKIEVLVDNIVVPSKIACTISVIINELLSNAIKHGKGAIELSLAQSGDNLTLKVLNYGSNFPENLASKVSGRNGLSIIDTLSKGDLQSTPSYTNISPNEALAQIEFSSSIFNQPMDLD